MLTIGLYPNLQKPGIIDVVEWAVKYLEERQVTVLLPKEAAEVCKKPKLGHNRAEMRRLIKLGITLGGDGTILHVAREVAAAGVPVCGINMGNLGFLTAAELSELRPALDKILAGSYSVEERMMLDASVLRQGNPVYHATALNDVVLTNGQSNRLIRLNVFVDDELIAGYPADGVVLATPTGSTGYSLSAGGPIINPNVQVIVLTPICPHTLYSRSLIITRQETVKVLPQQGQQGIVTVDGQSDFPMLPNDELVVKEAPDKARLVRFSDKSYYLTLRSKLRRGEIDATS